jgi:uncharacterized membrane protein
MWSSAVFGWAAASVILAFIIYFFVQWTRRNNMTTKWYDWTLLAIGLILLLFAIQNSITSVAENVSTAVWMWLVVVGLPALIIIVIPIQLIMRRQQAT